MSTFKGSTERLAEGVAFFSERVLPETEKQPGFAGALLLADSEAEVAYTLTFWEREEDLEAGSELARSFAEAAAKQLDMHVAISKCEVAYSRFGALAT